MRQGRWEGSWRASWTKKLGGQLAACKAKVVLAELTGKNVNVFYELGLAHALPKPAIFITAPLDDVPFDLLSMYILLV